MPVNDQSVVAAVSVWPRLGPGGSAQLLSGCCHCLESLIDWSGCRVWTSLLKTTCSGSQCRDFFPDMEGFDLSWDVVVVVVVLASRDVSQLVYSVRLLHRGWQDGLMVGQGSMGKIKYHDIFEQIPQY